jgi:hypothetical protein
MKVTLKPVLSGAVAVALGLFAQFLLSGWLPFARLSVEVAVLLAAYTGMLLYGMGQKTFYVDLLRGLFKRQSAEPEPAAAV